MRRTEKRKRFSFIKAFLILVVLAIISATSYYVYYASKQATNTLAAANKVTEDSVLVLSKGPSVKLTENWTGYSNQEGNFSLKYPTTWVQPSYRKLCSSGTFDRSIYLGSSAGLVLKCGSTNQGQVYVSSFIGDQRSKYVLSTDNYSDITTKTVGLNGIVGNKITGIVINASKVKPLNGLTDGTFVERYIFSVNNNTYVAQFVRAPTTTNQPKNILSDFDLMITKTLKFHS